MESGSNLQLEVGADTKGFPMSGLNCVVRLSLAAGMLLALCDARCTAAGTDTFPDTKWPVARPTEVGLDAAQLQAARDYALTGEGSGCITRHGKLVMTWGDPGRRYDLKSTTKSIGVTALGLAIADGKIALTDKVVAHHPGFGVPPDSNRQTGWLDRITIENLATQTAGFEKPGGYTSLVFEPGTRWSYSDGGPNWLAECVTLIYRRDVDELMFERVFTPLGISRADLVWRKNAYREARIEGVMRREFGSGISANVDAMARLGYLYLRGGQWNGRQIIPHQFVAAAGRVVESLVGLPEIAPRGLRKCFGPLWPALVEQRRRHAEPAFPATHSGPGDCTTV